VNEKVFSQSPRSDSSPGRATEPSFTFLDRRAGAFWDRVRSHVESCYADFPDDGRGLITRLQDPKVEQHLAAWWELYVFTLFHRLGYEVEVHPELPGRETDDPDKRPDFLVTRGSFSMYVEATLVFNDDSPNSDALNWVCDCINDAKNPDFMVDPEIVRYGTQRPAARKIIGPLEQWLASLNADRALDDLYAGRDLPRREIPADDWIVEYRAHPVQRDRRGTNSRLIGIYPTRPAAFGNDSLRLRKKLKTKGSKYNKLDKPLDKPLVVAMTTWNLVFLDDLKGTLFGFDHLIIPRDPTKPVRRERKLDGYWRPGSDPRGTRMSAVLFGETMRAWSVADRLPDLWINPWATNPLPRSEPFATVVLNGDGKLVPTAASTTGAEVFDLTPGWPNRD
jgi:hypothetical protein